MKNRYEVMYILRTDAENGNYAEEIGEFESLVENNGGEVEDVDEWGVRSLAYQINHQKEGYYVLMEFSFDSSDLPVLEEKLKLADNVLRYLVVKKE